MSQTAILSYIKGQKGTDEPPLPRACPLLGTLPARHAFVLFCFVLPSNCVCCVFLSSLSSPSPRLPPPAGAGDNAVFSVDLSPLDICSGIDDDFPAKRGRISGDGGAVAIASNVLIEREGACTPVFSGGVIATVVESSITGNPSAQLQTFNTTECEVSTLSSQDGHTLSGNVAAAAASATSLTRQTTADLQGKELNTFNVPCGGCQNVPGFTDGEYWDASCVIGERQRVIVCVCLWPPVRVAVFATHFLHLLPACALSHAGSFLSRSLTLSLPVPPAVCDDMPNVRVKDGTCGIIECDQGGRRPPRFCIHHHLTLTSPTLFSYTHTYARIHNSTDNTNILPL